MELMNLLRAQWDRALAVLCAIGGLVSILLGWIGTSGTAHVAAQMPYLVSNGLTGIFLLGIGAVLWMSADLRDEWRELRRVGTLLDRELSERRNDRLEQAPSGSHARG